MTTNIARVRPAVYAEDARILKKAASAARQAASGTKPQHFMAAFCGIIAGALMGCEMAISHTAATTLTPGTIGGIVAVAAVAVCALKMVWMPAASTFKRNNMMGASIAMVVFGLLAHAFSFAAIYGLVAMGREDMVSARNSTQVKQGVTEAEYRAAQAASERFRGQRPAAAVEADKKRIETSLADTEARAAQAASVEAAHASKLCDVLCKGAAKTKEAALNEAAGYRKALATIEAELQVSREADTAERRLAEARTAFQNAPAAIKNADPQAQAFVDLAGSFGWDRTQQQVVIYLLLVLALICELGAPLSANAAYNFWVGKPAQEAEIRIAPVVRAERVEPTLYEARPEPVQQAITDQTPAGPVAQLEPSPVSEEQVMFEQICRMIAHQPESEVNGIPGHWLKASPRPLGAALGKVLNDLDKDGQVVPVPHSTVYDALKRRTSAGHFIAEKRKEGAHTVTYITLPETELAELQAYEQRLIAAE